MSDYTPEALLAEASMKLDRLNSDLGIAFLEGEDDRRCLADRYIALKQLVIAGGKDRLLGAYDRADNEERELFVFLSDCDYDVPAGRLRPAPGLIVTRNASLETDLVEVGLLSQVVQELIPRTKWTGSLTETTSRVRDAAVNLAVGLGRVRLVARVRDVPIKFANLNKNMRRYRTTTGTDIAKIFAVLAADPTQPDLDESFRHEVEAVEPDLRLCDGHDLVEAIRVVLREDFRLGRQEVGAVDMLLRAALTRDVFDCLEFGQRLPRWEERTGRRVLIAVE